MQNNTAGRSVAIHITLPPRTLEQAKSWISEGAASNLSELILIALVQNVERFRKIPNNFAGKYVPVHITLPPRIVERARCWTSENDATKLSEVILFSLNEHFEWLESGSVGPDNLPRFDPPPGSLSDGQAEARKADSGVETGKRRFPVLL